MIGRIILMRPKGRLPRISKENYLINRTHPLAHDFSVYFPPGNTWRAKNSILIAPKVVWISLPRIVPFPINLNYTPIYATFTKNPSLAGSSGGYKYWTTDQRFNFFPASILNPTYYCTKDDLFGDAAKFVTGEWFYYYTNGDSIPYGGGNEFICPGPLEAYPNGGAGDFHSSWGDDPAGQPVRTPWVDGTYETPDTTFINHMTNDVLPEVKNTLSSDDLFININTGVGEPGAFVFPDDSGSWIGVDFLHIILGGYIDDVTHSPHPLTILSHSADYYMGNFNKYKKIAPAVFTMLYKSDFFSHYPDVPKATDLGDYSSPPTFGPIRVQTATAPVNVNVEPWIDNTAEVRTSIANDLELINDRISALKTDYGNYEKYANDNIQLMSDMMGRDYCIINGTIPDITAAQLIKIIKDYYQMK